MPKRTKIVATISSLNCTPEFLGKLYEAGMDVARLNTAHMSLEEAAKTVSNIRAVSDKIAIMIDTKGPEVRTAVVEPSLELHSGDRISISGIHDSGLVKVNYDDFTDFVEPGKRILIDDGELELMVLAKQNRVLECEALNDGTLKSRKSVNVPAVALPLPSLSTRDVEFINFAVENELDFIAHSFVRSKEDVLAVRELLNSANSKIGIIAKIENRQGVENLDEIAEAADGIMVARGDLGVEIPLAEVPEIQKRMICTCRKYCKPVITATQMLQSMIEHPRPTRAEVSDVANAVYDGTDAVMLSGETSAGRYPLEAVKMMANIIRQVEAGEQKLFIACGQLCKDDNPVRQDIVRFMVESQQRLPIKAIIGLTESGKSARIAAAYRGQAPLYFSCYNRTIARQLALSYGVYAYFHKYQNQPGDVFKPLIGELVRDARLNPRDQVACIGTFPPGVDNSNNFCCISRVGDLVAAESAMPENVSK